MVRPCVAFLAAQGLDSRRVMTTQIKQGATTGISPELAKRNVKMALIHLAIALGFLAAFVWSVSHR